MTDDHIFHVTTLSSGTEQISLQRRNIDSKAIAAAMAYVLHDTPNTLQISSLWVDPEYQNRGYGTDLIRRLVAHPRVAASGLRTVPPVRWVTLDDCSAVLPPHNLYYKLGASVVVSPLADDEVVWRVWKAVDGAVFDVDERRRWAVDDFTHAVRLQ